MRKIAILATLFATVLVLLLPFVGGSGPGLATVAIAEATATVPPLASTSPQQGNATEESNGLDEQELANRAAATAVTLAQDTEHLAQKAVPKPAPAVVDGDEEAASSPEERRAQLAAVGQSCPGMPGGGVGGAPGASSALGVPGTTSDDLASFAYQYNAIRVDNCLDPIPFGNFSYDSCMEARLFWMAESPSPDPLDAWGHMGSVRIDGVPSTGCDGNLAGGSGNSGATVAQKWWDSSSHRASLYRPGSSVDGVCIIFAMTHGGIDEPYDFTRAAARWTGC